MNYRITSREPNYAVIEQLLSRYFLHKIVEGVNTNELHVLFQFTITFLYDFLIRVSLNFFIAHMNLV